MNPPDNDIFTFIKDWLWMPLIALIGWAWHHNETAHDTLRKAQEKLQQNTANGYSVLNDRMMTHVDDKFEDVKSDAGKRIDTVNSHITKLFENAERDRAEFSKTMADHREDSFKRHIELMTAINAKADK